MGFHKASKEIIWGDEPFEILQEALLQIDNVYKREFKRDAHEQELITGCFWALRSHIGNRRSKDKG